SQIPSPGALPTKEKRGATTERAPPFPLSSGSLRLDQTKVTILPFIKHADTIRFSISKHNKMIIAVRKTERRFFGGHRLNAISAGRDDSHGWRRRLNLPVRIRRDH